MTQHEVILEFLETKNWVCTSKFYAAYIADPRTRLCELKKKGYLLESRKCESHDYHNGHSKEWKLIGWVGKESKPESKPEAQMIQSSLKI